MRPEIVRALATLEADPENADALASLSLLTEGGGNGHGRGAAAEGAADTAVRRALSEARRVHRERSDFELVVRLIDLELGMETDKERRADLYWEKGKLLAEELLREEEAVRAFERVLELRPGDEGAQETLGHIALVRDNWQKIVKKYRDEARDSTDRQLTTSLYLSMAEIYAKYQPDDHVEEYLKQALAIEPRNLKASYRLERLYRGEQRWDELLTVYQQRIEAGIAKEERVAAYLAQAELQEHKRGQRAEAAESYKQALALDPANSRALLALVAWYTAEENWQALVRVYEAALKARPRGEPETALHLQLGLLWWQKLGNLDSADEHWKKVRKAEPAHAAMLDFYRAHYAHDAQKLLAVLGQAQKVETDPRRRLELAVEMAQLAERSPGAAEKAIDLWKGALKLDPTQADAVAALERLYRKTEKWNALLELLKEAVEARPQGDIEGRVAKLLDVVAIYRDQLNLDVMVINTYNQILQLDPAHADALYALAQKYEAMGRWNDLIGVLTRTVEASTDPALKGALLRRIAGLWIEKFSNHNQAVKPLEELYALNPDDADTVERLREIYGKRRAWRALLELERKELARIGDAAAVRRKLGEMARLAADRLGDLREAIALWNQVLERDGEDKEALQVLAGLYERDRRWPALVEILRRQVGAGLELKQQLLLLEKVGGLFLERLNRHDKAVEVYQEIVRLSPSHHKAVRTLRDLYAAAGRYEELETLYRGLGQLDELCDILTGAAERLTEPAERLGLYRRVAELAERDAPERAAKAYERILALDPEDLAAAKALVPIYRTSERWARLLAVYEIILTIESRRPDADGASLLALHREIIRLCESKLGSKSLAFSWAARAYALRPAEPDVSAELERLAQEAEAWEELTEIYQAEAARQSDPTRQAERYRQLARIALTRLRKPELARQWFEAVLQHAPGDAEALGQLEQLHGQAGNFKALLAIYRQKAERTSDAEARREVLLKVARIEEEQLQDRAAAIATYRQLLAEELPAPARLRVLRALERMYAAQGDAPLLAATLEEQLTLCHREDEEGRLALLHRLGELYELTLDDPVRALTTYRAAWALAPAHPSTVAALERFLRTEGAELDRVGVARLLAPLYERRLAASEPEAARQLIAVLELERAQAAPAEQLELLGRLTKLASRLGDRQQAYDYALDLFALTPDDLEHRRLLAGLADQLDKLDDWAVRLGQAEVAAAKGGDLDLACALGWELGQLFDGRLGMPEDAEAAYRRVLGHVPDHEQAQLALAQLYSIHERWPELRALLDQKRQQALDPAARLTVLYQICDLDEGVLDDHAAATRDYVEVLELAPESQRALRALERLYADAENWPALDELLARRLAVGEASAESRAQLLCRRGELHAQKLADPEGATDLFEEALAVEPRHEAARRALETLMKRPELRQRIAKLLEPIYRSDEAWPKLALVLAARREDPELHAGGAEAAALAMQLARLQEERLGARQLALATWREALRLAPGDAAAQKNVERLAGLLGRPAELAAAWEEAFGAADPDDLALRGDLLERAARLYEEELHDVERARFAWKRLLELDPSHRPTAQPAAAALSRLYQAAEDWPSLIEVLRCQARWTADPNERKDLLFRVGRIEEELLADSALAVATYRQILEEDTADGRALDALERLHQAERRWPELIEVLRRRLDQTTGEARRDLMWRVAQLSERELGDTVEAIAGYHALLDERPEDLPALEALARLYEAQRRPADLLEILERRLALADRAHETGSAIRLRLQIAAILDGFGRQQEALERFDEVLQSDPQSVPARAGVERYLDDPDLRLQAAAVLEPLYRASQDLARQVRLAELWAEHAPDPRERIARLIQIAELRERGGEVEAAFEALSRAARIGVGEPELPSLLDRLERLLSATARPRLVALYRELGPDILDAAVQERVYLAVAAESHKLGDREVAREYYRRILDMAPDHPRALDALEGLYAEAREWEPLYEIYVRRAELTADDEERRRQYLMRLAELCEGALDRPLEAMSAYEQVLELFPNDAAASKALERHYVAAHRHLELSELLEQRLRFCDDVAAAVALRFRLAQLYDEELSDSERAVENYRAALGGDPLHAGAIRALERYLDSEDQKVAAAEVLEPTYVARHDWPALVRVYQIRLEATEEPRTRLVLIKRIARLYEEQLEDLDTAFSWYVRIFREEPEERSTREQLGRLAHVLGGWERLADAYESYLADEGAESPVGKEVLRAVAAIYHGRLEDVERAKGAYERLLELDPRDEAAFFNLEQLLARARRFSDLVEVYREAAERTEVLDRKVALGHQQATLLEEELGDLDGAIEVLRQLLDLQADDARARDALERLYTARKRWHDLIELVLGRLERVEEGAPAWVALQLRLAQIYEVELADSDAAIDLYEAVLARVEAQPEALRALERLIVDHDHTYRIAQLLEPIYRAQDAWQKLVVIYDAELEFIEDKPQRIARLWEIAEIHERRGGDLQLAFDALAKAFAEEAAEPDGEPRETALFDELTRLAAVLDSWRPLVEVLRQVVADSYDYDLQARVHGRIAEIQERRLADPSGAIESWQRVVAVRDDDLVAYAALERLHSALGHHRDLVRVLERRAGLVEELAEQKRLAQRVATLYEGPLRDIDSAISAWRHLLTLDETDATALDALERLYRTKGAFAELSTILSQKIDLLADPAGRRPLRWQLGQLWERELGDALAAIDVYKSILADDAGDGEALRAVARLYAAEGLWADHLEALDAEVELARAAGEPERQAELALAAAGVLEREVGDTASAIARYREVLFAGDAKKAQAGAKAALERLVREEGTRDEAASALEPFYEAQRDHHALIDLAELRLSGASDPIERRQLLARIAELQEAGLEDLQGAFAAWGRVLAEEPGDEGAQRELERLAQLNGAPDELARVYEERLTATFDPEVQRGLALKLGAIYESQLGHDARAITAYEKALELPGPDGADLVSLAALDRLLSRAARWRELAEVLEREAEATSDPEAESQLYYRLGALRAGELVDLDGALLAFREALARQPEHAASRAGLEKLLVSPGHAEAALELLEPLYEAEQNWEKLVQLGEVRVGITPDAATQAALLEAMAERLEQKLQRPARAVDALARALRLLPDESRLWDEVERLAQAAGDPSRAVAAFEAVLEADGTDLSSDLRVALALRTARLWERLDQIAKAEARYRDALAIDRENEEALAALERHYRQRGASAELLEILDRRAELTYDLGEKRRCLAEAAELAERALSDSAGAIDRWRHLRDLDEVDASAFANLARLYEAGGQWRELVTLLEQRVEPSLEAQTAKQARIATLWAEQLGDLDRAAQAYRDLLDQAPGSLPALAALEELEARRGDWLAVQEVLVQQLQTVGGGRAQIPVYRKLVTLALERQQSPEDAIGYLHEILALQPDEEQAHRDLCRLLEEAERYHDLIDVLTEQADRRAAAGDTEGELALLVRAADLWQERLENPEAATEILERILARDPSNAAALMSLAQIYEGSQQVEQARATLERALAQVAQSTAQAELHFRLGRLADTEEEGEEAYLRALALDPTHGGVLVALEKLARGREDWRRVVALLASRLEHAPKKERRPLLTELAEVYGQKLSQPEAALPYLIELHREAPDDATVVEPLAELYFAAGRFAEALPLYRELLAQLGKGRRTRQLGRLHQRLGAIAEKEGKSDEAMEHYQSAFQIDPQHAPTLVALGRLYLVKEEWEKARRIYRSMLLQNLDPQAGATKADIYLSLGQIHERLGEGAKALGMYERGLEFDGAHVALRAALGRIKGG